MVSRGAAGGGLLPEYRLSGDMRNITKHARDLNLRGKLVGKRALCECGACREFEPEVLAPAWSAGK
jgi:hypothetical protein